MAQHTFEKIYHGGSSFLQNITELPSGNILNGVGPTRAVSIVDLNGNLTHTHTYWADTHEIVTGLGGIRHYANNEFIFVAGYKKDSCTSIGGVTAAYFHPLVGKVDSMGTLLAIHHYILNAGCRNTSGDAIVTEDRGVLTWGYRQSLFLLKVDSNLAPLWARRFPNNGGFQFVKELPSGDLLAGINMDTAGAVVARMDAMGNFIWIKSYIRPRGMVHDAIIESDSSFVITGFTDSTASTNIFIPYPPTFHPQLFMMKLDGEGDVQWCKGYDSAPNLWYTPQWSRMVKAQDGNYVVLATLGYPQNNFFYRSILMKTDPNGVILWTSTLGRTGFDYQTRDLLAHSDGGFVLSGIVWGDLPQDGLPFIFKADSLGHIPCLNQSYPIVISDLFPTDSSFTLSSVDGATMQPAILNDTVFPVINVYDACIVTSVPQIKKSRSAQVKPNPNSGRFTVEFNDPLSVDSFYSVYDATGRLLFQRPLSQRMEKVEVDLSGYGKGMYLIRFSDRDGVCSERVVVE